MSSQQLNLLHDVAKAVDQASNFLRSSFGPLGLDKLVLTDSNQLLVTNSGHAILPLFPVAHPAAQQAMQAITATNRELQDGSTSMLLMLDAAFKQFWKEVGRMKGCFGTLAQQHVLAVMQALGALQARVLPGLLESVLESQAITIVEDDSHELRQALHCVVHTAWAGKTGSAVSQHLEPLMVDLIMDKLQEARPAPFWQTLKDVATNPPVISVAGMPVVCSHLIDGLLIRATFSSRHMPRALTSCKFVVMACSLELEDVGVGEGAVHVSTQQQYEALLGHKEQAVQHRLQLLQSRGVNLIFCTERVSEVASFYALDLGVNLVPLISNDDVDRICSAAGIQPITTNAAAVMESASAAEAVECRQVALSAGCKVICLQLQSEARTLVLCSPSEGLGAQYSALMRRALHLLTHLSFSSTTRQGLLVVGGGGTFDSAMAIKLEQLIWDVSQGCREHPLLCDLPHHLPSSAVTAGLKIMHAMSKAVPHALANSGSSGPMNAPSSPKQLVEDLFTAHRTQCECRLGLIAPSAAPFNQPAHTCTDDDTDWLVLASPTEFGVLEPAALRLDLWRAATDTLHQLLRLDGVLRACQTSGSGVKVQTAESKTALHKSVSAQQTDSTDEQCSEDSD